MDRAALYINESKQKLRNLSENINVGNLKISGKALKMATIGVGISDDIEIGIPDSLDNVMGITTLIKSSPININDTNLVKEDSPIINEVSKLSEQLSNINKSNKRI